MPEHSGNRIYDLWNNCRITHVHYAGSGQSIAFDMYLTNINAELADPPLFGQSIEGHVALPGSPIIPYTVVIEEIA